MVLLQQGRMSIAIGIVFVSLGLIAAMKSTDLAPVLAITSRESLTIVGWVAMWRRYAFT